MALLAITGAAAVLLVPPKSPANCIFPLAVADASAIVAAATAVVT